MGGLDIKFMTVAEVTKATRLSKMTIYRMIHEGELKATRISRSFRVDEQDVIALIKAGHVRP